MSAITTHVLEISRGKPAAGVRVTLSSQSSANEWKELASSRTDSNGRITDLLPAKATIRTGVHRLRFEIGEYFASQSIEAFYPYAEVVFTVRAASEHHHIPLLVSPFAYSTYRGS